MPLPSPPTRKPNTAANRQANDKANNELLFKGVLCTLIGLGVLLAPHFIQSDGVQNIVGKATVVGWFALVLGLAFIALHVRRRVAAAANH